MTYKDLNVYKRAYKVAIDLHLFLQSKGCKISPEQIQELKSSARDILGNIAESFAQRSPKAKRYFNYKARDIVNRILLNLEFLYDVKLLPTKEFKAFYQHYEICSKQLWKLNDSIFGREVAESATAEKKEVKEIASVK